MHFKIKSSFLARLKRKTLFFLAVFFISAMFSDFVSLIFPENCASCQTHLYKNEEFICLRCRVRLPKTNYHMFKDNPLARRLWGRIPLIHAFAFLRFEKGGPVQKMLYQIKYNGAGNGSFLLGKLYGSDLRQADTVKEFDSLVPVPLHKKKLRKRGFNQSGLFADGLAEALGMEAHPEWLIRDRDRQSQTGMARFDRWLNVKDIYKVPDKISLEGKKILIADDVVTTGATIESCGKALLDAGAAGVGVVAIACAM